MVTRTSYATIFSFRDTVEGAGFTIERTDIGLPNINCLRFFFVLENGTLSLKDTTLAHVDSDGNCMFAVPPPEAMICPPCMIPCYIPGEGILKPE